MRFTHYPQPHRLGDQEEHHYYHHENPWGAPHRGHGPRGGGRGMRARRGDVRLALLSVLEEGPANGYGLIKRIEERTDGMWKTSPGSTYPTLAQLVDEGMVSASPQENGGTVYALTDSGKETLRDEAARIAEMWSGPRGGYEGGAELREAVGQLKHSLRTAAIRLDHQGRVRLVAMIKSLQEEIEKL